MQILDFLIPHFCVDYDLSLPPSLSNAGSGVGVKYARVVEAGEPEYLCRRIDNVNDVQSDIVFADWLWFCTGEDEGLIDRIKAFLALENKIKIIYGSELCVLAWSRNVLDRLLSGVNFVTHNTDYQRKMYRILGIYNSMFLCDPIPPRFTPSSKKERRLVCMGQISEAKRSEAVIDIFTLLSDTDVETVYLGGRLLWGSPNNNRQANDMQREIKNIADVFIENADEETVTNEVNISSFFGHVAYHDVASCSQQENATAGNITFALTHPTMKERTPYLFDDVETLAEAVSDYTLESEQHNIDKNRAIKISEQWSYQAWNTQIEDILRLA